MRKVVLKAILFLILIGALTAGGAFAMGEEEEADIRFFKLYADEPLIETPTRFAMPLSVIADNVTIVSAEEIQAFNAHTLAEVLARISGIFVNINDAGLGSPSLIHIFGSDERHVEVRINGLPINFLNSGGAETNSIPVGTIKKIEIVKSPASSSWGSAMGGIINVITKRGKEAKQKVNGLFRASYGKKNTYDCRAELFGKGPVDYYLYADTKGTDGLRDSGDFEAESLFASFQTRFSPFTELDVSLLFCSPATDLGDIISQDIKSKFSDRVFFGSASLNSKIADEFSLFISINHSKHEMQSIHDNLGLNSAPGEPYLHSFYDEESTGSSLKLIWEDKDRFQTLVLGADYSHGRLKHSYEAGEILQDFGAPAEFSTNPYIDEWAVFINDTFVFDRWSLSPGVRYDHNNISGSHISPTLGATYWPRDDTIVRMSVSGGFSTPPLSWTSGGALFLEPNPSLEYEKIWSFQTGVESKALDFIRLKTSVFYHDIKDAIVLELSERSDQPPNDRMINDGKIRRHGLEFEAETAPIFNFSLFGSFAYVDMEPEDSYGSDHLTSYNIAIRYDDDTLRAELFGRYVKWDVDSSWRSEDDFVWDLNITKRIRMKGKVVELFFTGHNIFDGNQFINSTYKNPRRWAEGGLRVYF